MTAEAAYWRGLLPQLRAAQDEAMAAMSAFAAGAGTRRPFSGQGQPTLRGHFGGLWVLDEGQLDPDDPEFAPNPATGVVMVNQQAVERIFGAWAREQGAQVRRGVELVGFDEHGGGVTVELANGERITADWLVGCDGGRSTVRKIGGFDFPGTDPTITGHQAIVDIEGAEKLPVGWTRTPTGMMVYGPVPGRILTIEYDGPPIDRGAPITRGSWKPACAP